eukprot:Lankesteria_metandrocarpae@DN3364_c0_g1_i1.p1
MISGAMSKIICCFFQFLVLSNWLVQNVDAQECYLSFSGDSPTEKVLHGEVTFQLNDIRIRIPKPISLYGMKIETQRPMEVGVSEVDDKASCNIAEINIHYPYIERNRPVHNGRLSCEDDVWCYLEIGNHTFPVLRKPVVVPSPSRSVRRASMSNKESDNHNVGKELLKQRFKDYFVEWQAPTFINMRSRKLKTFEPPIDTFAAYMEIPNMEGVVTKISKTTEAGGTWWKTLTVTMSDGVPVLLFYVTVPEPEFVIGQSVQLRDGKYEGGLFRDGTQYSISRHGEDTDLSMLEF